MTSPKEHESHHSYAQLAEEAARDGEQEQASLLKEAWSEAAGHGDESGDASHSPQEESPVPPTDGKTEALAQEVADLKDQLLRAVAETENVRRRAQRDVEEAGKYATTNFARDIVSVCDNLWRAAAAIPPEARQGGDLLATIAQGVDMTLQELLSVLERFQIKRIDPLGEAFDHNLHQAVVQIDSPDAQPGTVMQVMQAGYTLHGRLLRPAMVGVAKRPESSSPQPQVDTQA